MRWGDRVEPLAKSEIDLPPTDQTVFELLQGNRDFYAPIHADEATEANPG